MSQSRRKAPTGRTNSLGFAKTDCHTCHQLSRHCDRQRPQCATCIKDQRKCAGFAVDLTWDTHAPAGNPRAVHIRGERPKRGFQFVEGGARSKRKVNGGPKHRHNSPDIPVGHLEESIVSTTGSDSPSYILGSTMDTEASTPISPDSLEDQDSLEAVGTDLVQFRSAFTPTPTAVLFNDLAHKMEPVLTMCETRT